MRERKEIPNKHLVFAVQVLHFTEYDFYELHADVL